MASAVRRRFASVSAAAAVVFLSFPAVPAFAHADLIASGPGPNSSVRSPATITLRFNEPITVTHDSIVLTGKSGRVAGVHATKADDVTLRATVPDVLPAGHYTVSWRCVGDDGHVIDSAFSFTVLASADRPAAAQAAPVAAAPSSSVRTVATTGKATGAVSRSQVDPQLLAQARSVVAAGRPAARRAQIAAPPTSDLGKTSELGTRRSSSMALPPGLLVAAGLGLVALVLAVRRPIGTPAVAADSS